MEFFDAGSIRGIQDCCYNYDIVCGIQKEILIASNA